MAPLHSSQSGSSLLADACIYIFNCVCEQANHGQVFSLANHILVILSSMIIMYRQCAMNALLDDAEWFSHQEGFVAVSIFFKILRFVYSNEDLAMC